MIKKNIFKILILTMIFSAFAQTANAEIFYFWRERSHATDCTSLTDGKQRDLCYEEDSANLYKCEPTAGDCSGSEWKLINPEIKNLYDAQTILHATSDNTPVALTVTEQTVVGRATGGNIAAIAIDNDLSSVSGSDDTVASAKATKAYADDNFSQKLIVGITIDGGGSAIVTGSKGFIEVSQSCTISKATVLADQSGSIVIDVWKDSYANYPPTDADSITASAPPTISTATKSQDSTLTGWTTSVSSGDILGFNVDSITTITRASLILECDL